MQRNSPRTEPFVFIHIGKTAGSAIRTQLVRYFWPRKVCPLVFHLEIEKLEAAERARYKLFSAHIGYQLASEITDNPDHIFSLMRDPVDRVLSLYYYWRESVSESNGPSIARENSLDEFLDSDKLAVIEDAHNTQTWQLAIGHSARTRGMTRKKHSEDWIFEQAIRNVSSLGVIGVQEHLGQFIDALNNHYNWKIEAPDRVNETNHRLARDQISEESRRKIEANNAMDVELYAHVMKHYVGSS